MSPRQFHSGSTTGQRRVHNDCLDGQAACIVVNRSGRMNTKSQKRLTRLYKRGLSGGKTNHLGDMAPAASYIHAYNYFLLHNNCFTYVSLGP